MSPRGEESREHFQALREQARIEVGKGDFDEALKWVGDRKTADEPFFLYLPTNAPHAPLWVPQEDRLAVEEYFAENEHKLGEWQSHMRASIVRFLAMIRNLDTQIGRLISTLDSQKKLDNTFILFISTPTPILG